MQAGAVSASLCRLRVASNSFSSPCQSAMCTPSVCGRAEAHAVFQVARQERRHMEGLGHGEMLVNSRSAGLGRQHVVVALAPRGVGHFTQDRGQLSVGLEAVEETHRVKRQAPTAGLGQQADNALRRMPEAMPTCWRTASIRRMPLPVNFQVIGFAKGKGAKRLFRPAAKARVRVLFISDPGTAGRCGSETHGSWAQSVDGQSSRCTGRCSQGFPKGLGHAQCADHAVFMEAIGPVGAAIKAVLRAR